MSEKIKIEIELSKDALARAIEVIEETGDEFGPGMCPYPDSDEWSEFKSAFEDATKDYT